MNDSFSDKARSFYSNYKYWIWGTGGFLTLLLMFNACRNTQPVYVQPQPVQYIPQVQYVPYSIPGAIYVPNHGYQVPDNYDVNQRRFRTPSEQNRYIQQRRSAIPDQRRIDRQNTNNSNLGNARTVQPTQPIQRQQPAWTGSRSQQVQQPVQRVQTAPASAPVNRPTSLGNARTTSRR